MPDGNVPEDTTVVHTHNRGRSQAYLDPVLTLPNEIVSEIFIQFLPPYPECPPWGNILRSPTLLTQICKKWRDIALSTPQLWRAVNFELFRAPSRKQRRRRVHMDTTGFETWLSRSRACPLSLQIFEHESRDLRVSEILTAAIRHRARWEYLKIEVEQAYDLLELDGPFPLLRHLDLNLGIATQTKITAFCDAPLLCSAGLHSRAVETIVLPWVQLISLVLRHVTPHHCSFALTQAPNLIHCELGSILAEDDNTPQPASPPAVRLPCLESLVIGVCHSAINTTVAVCVLESLTLPALLRLRIAEDCLGDANPVQALRSFISQTGCKAQDVRVCIFRKNFRVPEAEYRAAFPGLCFEEGGDDDLL
ncbi:hypothetical protein C8R46DRAFT_1223397 [Mycena filopes]|nr:hypothetical protein C8R46DRAFT_1223397 [Mycena filopes]